MDCAWIVFLAGESAGVVNKEGAAAKEPGEGDGPDQKSSGSCSNIKEQGYQLSQTFVLEEIHVGPERILGWVGSAWPILRFALKRASPSHFYIWSYLLLAEKINY